MVLYRYTYQIVWAAIKLIILGVCLFFLFKSFKISKSYESTAVKIKEIHCSDEFSNSLFDDYGDSQLGSKTYTIVIAALWVFSMVVTIAAFIVGMIQRRK